MSEEMKFSGLANELSARYSAVRTELEEFDSGVKMLRIYYQNRYFVIAGDHHGVFLDEPKEADGFTSSFRYRFSDLGSASKMLFGMMSMNSAGGPASVAAATPPQRH